VVVTTRDHHPTPISSPADRPADRTEKQKEDMEVTPMQLAPFDLSTLTGRVIDEQLPCRVNDPELWFAESPVDVEFAKALCTACPLAEMCLEGALVRREPWGVWGGQLVNAGVVVPRKRPRGRPRKHAAG